MFKILKQLTKRFIRLVTAVVVVGTTEEQQLVMWGCECLNQGILAMSHVDMYVYKCSN